MEKSFQSPSSPGELGTPRQCLGSNWCRSPGLTEAEDSNFKVRALWLESNGIKVSNENLYEQVRLHSTGILIMDSRGIYDASARNISSLHGGYELTLAVQEALRINTTFRWVNGLAQVADVLTNFGEWKVFLQLLSRGQCWKLIHDDQFTAGRRIKKQELERQIRETEDSFIRQVAAMAKANHWPWEEHEGPHEPRVLGMRV